MKTKLPALSLALILAVATARAADTTAPKENVFETKPLGIKLSIKMVGPYMEAADLQIICLFKHKPSGDTYQGAAKDTDAHLGGLLSALRNRGEFVGEPGETFLFTPPKGSIPAKRFMVIGLGDEKDVSLDTLRVVGRVAAHTSPGRRSSATKAIRRLMLAKATVPLLSKCYWLTTRRSVSRRKNLHPPSALTMSLSKPGLRFSTAL